MLVLTATANGQGARENDFTWTIEGELVWPGLICARDRSDPDGGCGCGRAFSGLNSQRATTTAIVRDLALSVGDVRLAVAAYLEDAGYGSWGSQPLVEAVDELLDVADSFGVGAIVERRLEVIQLRQVQNAPGG